MNHQGSIHKLNYFNQLPQNILLIHRFNTLKQHSYAKYLFCQDPQIHQIFPLF